MKTLALNKKHLLFGMLVVSLGLTKSWLQAPEQNGSIDLARITESQPTGAGTQQTVISNQEFQANFPVQFCGATNFKFKISSQTRTPTQGVEIVNGEARVVTTAAATNISYANYTVACIDDGKEKIYSGTIDITAVTGNDNVAIAVRQDVEKSMKAMKLAEEQAQKIKMCEVDSDGEEFGELNERMRCLNDRLTDIKTELKNRSLSSEEKLALREEKAGLEEQFNAAIDEAEEELQTKLEEAELEEDPKEKRKLRREALNYAKKLNRDFGGRKSDFRNQFSVMIDAAQTFQKISSLSDQISTIESNYSQDPNVRLWQNWQVDSIKRQIDMAAWKFNDKDNPNLNQPKCGTGGASDFCPSQQARKDWSDLIISAATQSITGTPTAGGVNTERQQYADKLNQIPFNVTENNRDTRTLLGNYGLPNIPLVDAGQRTDNRIGTTIRSGGRLSALDRLNGGSGGNRGNSVYDRNYPTGPYQVQSFDSQRTTSGNQNGLRPVRTGRG